LFRSVVRPFTGRYSLRAVPSRRSLPRPAPDVGRGALVRIFFWEAVQRCLGPLDARRETDSAMGETHLYNNGHRPAPSPVADAPGLAQLYHPPARALPAGNQPSGRGAHPPARGPVLLRESTCTPPRDTPYPSARAPVPLRETLCTAKGLLHPVIQSSRNSPQPTRPTAPPAVRQRCFWSGSTHWRKVKGKATSAVASRASTV